MVDDDVAGARLALMRAIPAPLLAAAGHLDAASRRAAFDHGAAPGSPAHLPEPLARFVDKVATEAYRVVDGDVAEVRDAGYSDDAVLEAVLATAMGAGLSRLEIGLATLAGQRPAT
ncbi:MAG: hypothetical protein M3066_04995 [Actinomycetota bacterium]|nr:hypothetical protein [Actinomycetota bacterium]